MTAEMRTDLATLAFFISVAVTAGLVFLGFAEGNSKDMCLRACGPRRGVVVDGACYCENEGEDLIPIEQLIPDTGNRKCTDQP